jgi:hypothetical protein
MNQQGDAAYIVFSPGARSSDCIDNATFNERYSKDTIVIERHSAIDCAIYKTGVQSRRTMFEHQYLQKFHQPVKETSAAKSTMLSLPETQKHSIRESRTQIWQAVAALADPR